jgi:hypothetical protein
MTRDVLGYSPHEIASLKDEHVLCLKRQGAIELAAVNTGDK